MTTFFDDLERQLVGATTDRTRRLRRARNRTVATLCAVVLALLATGGGLAAALSSTATDTTNNPAATGAQTAPPTTVQLDPRTGRPTVTLPPPGSFEVAVLNGTTTPGLARSVAMRLQARRFKIGTVTNAATHGATTTHVYYASPRAYPAAAATVEALGTLTHTLPRPATRAMTTIAGEAAGVIVVAGSQVTPPTG